MVSLSMKPVTPNNNVTFEGTIGLYLGVSGDVTFDTANGDKVTLKNLASGVIHPISVTRIYLTGTTATNIVGVY